MARKAKDLAPPGGATMAETVARMRQVASEAQDYRLLADGPPHPDAELLGLAARALELKQEIERSPVGASRTGSGYRNIYNERQSVVIRMGRLPAKTGAGIYAKAMTTSFSSPECFALARSAVVDLLENPGLRRIVWPAGEPENGCG